MVQTEQIIAVAIILSFCFAALMAVVTRFLAPKHGAFTSKISTIETNLERQPELTHISRSWKLRFTEKQKNTDHRWVPSLSAIVEAGDESFFTSELFDEHHDKLHLDNLYQAFATKLQTRPPSEKSAYSDKISKFITESKQDARVLGRAKSTSRKASNGPTDGVPRVNKRNSNPLTIEGGLKRRLSVKKPVPALMPFGSGLAEEGAESSVRDSWMHDFQIAGLEDGRMCIKPSPIEIVAASLILASPLALGANSENARPGAFGISMSMRPIENGGYQVQLQGQKRSISQQHASGAGVSTLLAKHLAAGSLPYAQDKEAVHSILLTNKTVEAIQAGVPLQIHGNVESTVQSRFISSLPSSRTLKFYALAPSTEQISFTPLIDAVAGLPFVGGLAPLASRPFIKTIQFIATGGLVPGRLLQRLEDLVDKFNTHAPHLDIFGPLYKPQNAGLVYRERSRLGRLAKSSAMSDSLADKTGRMSRYITLLQRLMALIPDTKPKEVLAAIRRATKIELQRSYTDAVAAHTKLARVQSPVDSPDSYEANTRMECQSTNSTASASLSNPASTAMKPASSPSTPHPQQDLDKQVEKILRRELPLDIDAIAFIARMVIVAWTLSVETVAWEDNEEGFRLPNIQDLGNNIIMY